MTHLTRITVRKAEAAKLGLHDCYAWHRSLWKAFPGKDGKPRDFLFRIDDRRAFFQTLLLSPERPSLLDWGEWQTRSVAPTFLHHERYHFQLRANPTIRRVVFDDRTSFKDAGRRVGIFDEQGLEAWLKRRAGAAGFQILKWAAGPPRSFYFTKNHHRGKHIGADFEGLLQVTERQAFEKAFKQGIGPAKAFGFGLLMLQPCREA